MRYQYSFAGRTVQVYVSLPLRLVKHFRHDTFYLQQFRLHIVLVNTVNVYDDIKLH